MKANTTLVWVGALLLWGGASSPSAADSSGAIVVQDEYLIRKEPGANTGSVLESLRAKASAQVTLIDEIPSERLLRVRIQPASRPRTPALQASAIAANSVKWAGLFAADTLEPVVQYRLAEVPTDRTIAIVGAGDLAKRIGIQALANKPSTAPSRQIIVAVIDTGFQLNHEIFKGLLLPGIDVTLEGQKDAAAGDPARARKLSNGAIESHGTGTAGMLALVLRGGKLDGEPIADVKILPIRAASSVAGDQRVSSADAIKAFSAALSKKAAIISVSWGDAGDSNELKRKFTEANLAQALVFAAAGNGRRQDLNSPPVGYNIDQEKSHIYPASWQLPNLVSVAALDDKERLARFSNWGPASVQLAAPGDAVLAPIPEVDAQGGVKSGYQTASGTSYATPIVAAMAAVYLSNHPDATTAQVAKLIVTAVEKEASLTNRILSGGRLSGLRISGPSKPQGAVLASFPPLDYKPKQLSEEAIQRWIQPAEPQTLQTGGTLLKGLDSNGATTRTQNTNEFLVRLKPGQSMDAAIDSLPILAGTYKGSREVDKNLFEVQLDTPSGDRTARDALRRLPGVTAVESSTSFQMYKQGEKK